MMFLEKIWLIPLFPALGALAQLLFGRKLSTRAVSAVSVGLPGLSFLWAVGCLLALLGQPEHVFASKPLYSWLPAGTFRLSNGSVGSLNVDVGFLLDPLSAVMVLVVTGVGLLIHIYSIGYMAHEGGYYRFFGYLNLFMFSMLILVLANNYLMMFVGWEGVGLCSYLLIGFYFLRKSASDAGKKAFVVNRVGDAGFLLGVMLMAVTFGTLNFQEVTAAARSGRFPVGDGVMTAICVLLSIGATGKSAQIPLYVWLPDAMEGPTPVSALIHAATMVTAGVYMVARSNALFMRAPTALALVAGIGAATAILAASIGLVQNDIKRVLAYSTVSQLGYMFLACGVGAFAAGIFHLMTHAFFKALLFLGAGSVIHAVSGEQDMRRMGGLREKVPQTFRTMQWATYAIAGLPLGAGFFSKDEILSSAWSTPYFPGVGKAIWAIATIAAFSPLLAIAGWWLAKSRYQVPQLAGDESMERAAPRLATTLEHKYYVDEFYDEAVVTPLEEFSEFLWRGIDGLIDGTLALVGYVVAAIGDLLRFFQTGNVRNYALMFFAGVIVFLWVLA